LTNTILGIFFILLALSLLYCIYNIIKKKNAHNVQSEYQLDYNFDNINSILSKGKKVLILAPHQDDEALMCSGVISHSINNGADVKLGVITNGDKKGKKRGLIRIRETITAMEYLGISSSNIHFFGYGDTEKNGNSFMNRLYNAAADTTLVPSYASSQTYSTPEAPEYHFTRFGVHGSYDRATFRQDLNSFIKEYNPDYIFVTSLYDSHPDHFILYKFTVEAIINIKQLQPEFSPIIYEYLIHSHDGDDDWPARNDKNSVLESFSKPATLETHTLLDWGQRETFLVPIEMQTASRSKNKKYAAISKYRSQRPSANNRYLYSYVKKDEIFWKRDFSNIAYLAKVSVSSENASTDQLGIKVIDGIADGYPRFPANEWVAQGETTGAWVKLSWIKPYIVSKIRIFDRPNLDDHITRALITFSDGTTLTIGPLPNNGSCYEIKFAARQIEWVKMTVVSANGANVGLSEFEIYEENPVCK